MVRTRSRMHNLEIVYRERKVRTRGNKMEERRVSQRLLRRSLVSDPVSRYCPCTVFIRPDHWDHPYLASSSFKETPIIHAKRFQTVWICSSSREVRQMENELPVRGVRPRRWGSQTMISFGVTWSTGATSSLEWWSRRLVLAIRFY